MMQHRAGDLPEDKWKVWLQPEHDGGTHPVLIYRAQRITSKNIQCISSVKV